MSILEELMSCCKGGVFIFINEHRTNKETVTEYLADIIKTNSVSRETLKGMIKADSVICIQAHPYHAISFYQSFHYDITTAAALILEQIKAESN